jgi:hypothetical protein
MKRFIAAFLAAALLMSCCELACASGAGTHWQDMRRVLLGSKNTPSDDEIKKKCEILGYAISLAIDQYQNSGESYLARLKQLGVPRLPRDISEINLDADARNHRKYTHCGWNDTCDNYKDDYEWVAQVWPMRQDILRISVEYVFDFNGMPPFIDAMYMKPNEKREAFCILLYCTHVLGDHKAYSSSSYNVHEEDIMPITSSERKSTIIFDLKMAIATLFPEQEHSELRSELERKLDAENKKICALINAKNTKDANQWIEEYKAHADKIIEILSQHIPQMLQKEEFFSSKFPHGNLPGYEDDIAA